MFTIEYHGYYIHGYIDKPDTSVSPAEGGHLGNFTNMLGAKRFILQLVRG